MLGKDHVLTERFGDIRYSPGSHVLGDTIAFDNARRGGIGQAAALLRAAIFELELAEPEEEVLASLVVVELWSKIDHLVAGEKWDQVVSQSVIFFEHWVR